MNKYYVKEQGFWCHKTPLKLFVNPILRKLQWYTNKPYVIGSKTDFVDHVPQFRGYGFQRVEYKK